VEGGSLIPEDPGLSKVRTVNGYIDANKGTDVGAVAPYILCGMEITMNHAIRWEITVNEGL